MLRACTTDPSALRRGLGLLSALALCGCIAEPRAGLDDDFFDDDARPPDATADADPRMGSEFDPPRPDGAIGRPELEDASPGEPDAEVIDEFPDAEPPIDPPVGCDVALYATSGFGRYEPALVEGRVIYHHPGQVGLTPDLRVLVDEAEDRLLGDALGDEVWVAGGSYGGMVVARGPQAGPPGAWHVGPGGVTRLADIQLAAQFGGEGGSQQVVAGPTWALLQEGRTLHRWDVGGVTVPIGPGVGPLGGDERSSVFMEPGGGPNRLRWVDGNGLRTPSSGSRVRLVAVNEFGLYWVDEGGLHRARRSDGRVEHLWDQPCERLAARGEVMLAACASVNHDQMILVIDRAGAPQTISANIAHIAAVATDGRRIAFARYDDPRAWCAERADGSLNLVEDIFAPVAQVVDVAPLAAGCDCCDAIWPDVRIVLQDDVLAWNYAIDPADRRPQAGLEEGIVGVLRMDDACR